MDTFIAFSGFVQSLVVLYLVWSVFRLNRRVAVLEDLVIRD